MHYNNLVIILYILCTLQLQPYLLTMESKQSANTSTSMTKEQGPMPPAQNTAHGKKKSSVTVTSSTPNPVPTSAVHNCVTDVAELISASADLILYLRVHQMCWPGALIKWSKIDINRHHMSTTHIKYIL